MKFGLSEKHMTEIRNILSRYSQVERGVLFGSRATGNHWEASDVDIAIDGDAVDWKLASSIEFHFAEDTYLPFFFDVVAYPTINSQELKEHINKKGATIYRRERS